MPKIILNKEGGIIRWGAEDWLACLHPQTTGSVAAIRKLGNFLAATLAMDPYRNLGSLTPGFNPTDLINVSVIDAVQLNAVVQGTNAYSIGGTKLHKIGITDETIVTPTTFPHTISGASAGQDVVMYDMNVSSTRTRLLFYSWKDGSNGNIGTYDLSTTFDDDWMSTVPANAAAFDTINPHHFIVGADDILYVTDGNKIHAIDGATGANGTLSKGVLILPKQYVAVGFARLGTRTLAVFAYENNSSAFYLGRATVFLWNYLDLDPYDVIELDDNCVSAPFEYQGTIGCFTSGRVTDKDNSSKNVKLKLYDGRRFRTKVNFIGSLPSIGGVDILDEQIQWNAGGTIYAWGNNFGTTVGLNQVGAPTGSSVGLLKSLSTVLQICSSGTTTSGGLQKFNTNYASNTLVAGVLAEPPFPISQRGRVTKVRVKFMQTATGGRTVTVQIRTEAQSNWEILDAVSTISAGTLILEKEYKNDGTPLPVFDSIKPIVSYGAGAAATSAPIIDEIEIQFEYINISQQ